MLTVFGCADVERGSGFELEADRRLAEPDALLVTSSSTCITLGGEAGTLLLVVRVRLGACGGFTGVAGLLRGLKYKFTSYGKENAEIVSQEYETKQGNSFKSTHSHFTTLKEKPRDAHTPVHKIIQVCFTFSHNGYTQQLRK